MRLKPRCRSKIPRIQIKYTADPGYILFVVVLLFYEGIFWYPRKVVIFFLLFTPLLYLNTTFCSNNHRLEWLQFISWKIWRNQQPHGNNTKWWVSGFICSWLFEYITICHLKETFLQISQWTFSQFLFCKLNRTLFR